MLTAASAMAFLPETMRKRSDAANHDRSGKDGKGKSAPATKRTELAKTLNQWRTMLAKPDIQGISGVAFINGLLQGSYAVTTMIYISEVLDFPPSEAGMMFTAAVFAMAVMTKPATDFSDWYVKENKTNCRSTLIVPGLGMAALATGMRGLEIFPSALPFTALFVASHVASAALVSPNVTPFLVDATTEDQRAQALAMRNMAQTLGAVSQTVGVPEAILCSAALQALTMVFFAMQTSPGRQKKGLSKEAPRQGN